MDLKHSTLVRMRWIFSRNRKRHRYSCVWCEISGQDEDKNMMKVLGLEEIMDQLVKANNVFWCGTDRWNVVRKALVSLLRGQERIGGML